MIDFVTEEEGEAKEASQPVKVGLVVGVGGGG
jgi:hypothetical protein